jgi:hypothetical protein
MLSGAIAENTLRGLNFPAAARQFGVHGLRAARANPREGYAFRRSFEMGHRGVGAASVPPASVSLLKPVSQRFEHMRSP